MATLNNNNKKSGKAMIFFLGVITGLIIAIIVAFFVSRSPFSSKKAENQAPATPLTANSTADPNQALYGKNPPPHPQSATPPAATAPSTPPTTAPANTLQTPPQATSVPVATSPINSQTTTYLQVGAYKSRAEAETMRGKVALCGFQSFITTSTSGLGTIYRVRLGPYQGNEYVTVQSKLKQNNITSAVTH